jgi:hypothetical protein
MNGAWDCDGDFLFVRETMAWLELEDPAAEIERLWRIAFALVIEEWPGILRAGRVLRERKFMEGEQFEQIWRDRRPAAATKQSLSADFGMTGWRERLVMPELMGPDGRA